MSSKNCKNHQGCLSWHIWKAGTMVFIDPVQVTLLTALLFSDINLKLLSSKSSDLHRALEAPTTFANCYIKLCFTLHHIKWKYTFISFRNLNIKRVSAEDIIQKVGSIQVNQWAESKAIAPRCSEVNHFDEVTIWLQLTLEPFQQDVTVSQHVCTAHRTQQIICIWNNKTR